MFFRFFVLITLFFVTSVLGASAQSASSTRTNAADASRANSYERGREEEPTKGMLETRYRWQLREAEKDHREMLDRCETVARLSKDLYQSFQQNNTLTANDSAKLSEIEKLLKKLRKSMGGDDDEAAEQNNPSSVGDALDKFAQIAAALNDELKESTRYEISASSIENTNEMLKLLAFIRKLTAH